MTTEPTDQQITATIADAVTRTAPHAADAAVVSASIGTLTSACDGDDSTVQTLVMTLGRMYYATMQDLAARALRAEAELAAARGTS